MASGFIIELLKSVGIEPQIVLDIEGVNPLFAARPVFKNLEWDEEDASWDSGLLWDGSIADSNAVDWISLNILLAYVVLSYDFSTQMCRGVAAV